MTPKAPKGPSKEPQVELGKETRREILDALKNIKSQISQAKQRESTPADVAADILASGGGPIAAAKEALAFKAAKARANLKRRLDPLNIIHRMTGSKLATTVAGRLTGRSEASIRSAAGLQATDDTSKAFAQPHAPATEESKTTPIGGGKLNQTFDQMAKTLAIIATRVQDIADKMKASKKITAGKDARLRDAATGKFVSSETAQIEKDQRDFLYKIWDKLKSTEEDTEESTEYLKQMAKSSAKTQEMLEKQRDEAAAEKYKSEFTRKAPTQMGKVAPEPAGDKKSSWITALLAMVVASAKSFISLLSKGFSVAAEMLGQVLSKTVTALKEKIAAAMSGVWELLGKVGSLAKEGALGALGMVKRAGEGILNTGKDILGIPRTVEPPKTVPTTPGKVPTTSPGGAATTVPKPSVKEIIKQQGPKMMSKIGSGLAKSLPFVGAAYGGVTAIKSLLSGDKTQAAIDAGASLASLTGAGGMAALPVTVAASLANDVYKQMYGIDPLSDVSKESRLPEIADAASEYVKEFLSAKAEQVTNTPAGTQIAQEIPTVPSTVSPIAPPQPTSGAALMESADLKASGGTQPASTGGAAIVNNVRNNNVTNSTIHQGMASPRSSESSFLRYVNKDFVPA